MKLPVYYAKDLLKSPAQAEAAHSLMMALLVRRLMRGERVSYWERKWQRSPASLFQSVARMRSLLVAREKGYADLTVAIPDPMPLRELEAKPDVYGPMLDRIEMEACMELDDGRTEALIRQMFSDTPQALFAFREPNPVKRTKAKRGPGRPKGSKNKPKTPQHDGEGWLMPDGSRLNT